MTFLCRNFAAGKYSLPAFVRRGRLVVTCPPKIPRIVSGFNRMKAVIIVLLPALEAVAEEHAA
jgi:hypothetical protein